MPDIVICPSRVDSDAAAATKWFAALSPCGSQLHGAVLVLAAAVMLTKPTAADVIHVDADAAPGGDGTSWATAFDDLQNGLDAATAGDELWVAEGVYKPDRNTLDRTRTFLLRADAAVYGGFDGSESSREQRDHVTNLTVLSGDLESDDRPGFVNYDDNSFNVVTVQQLPNGSIAELDGFLVRGGSAYGSTLDTRRGGGMRASALDVSVAVRVVNCTFADNQAFFDGGGLAVLGGSPTIRQCLFIDNRCEEGGAGLYCSSVPVVIRECVFHFNQAGRSGGGAAITNFRDGALVESCEFMGNAAGVSQLVGNGGGLHVAQSLTNNVVVTINQCHFETNTCWSIGGGLYISTVRARVGRTDFVANHARAAGGGAGIEPTAAVPLHNCRFLGNSTQLSDGGGLYLTGGDPHEIANGVFIGNHAAGSGGGLMFPSSTLDGRRIINCTVAANSATQFGGGLYVAGGTRPDRIHNSVTWLNTDVDGAGQRSQIYSVGNPSVNYSCVQGWTGSWGGAGNHGNDPLFVDLDGDDDTLGTTDDDVRVQGGSPLIDAGNSDVLPLDPLDLDDDGNTGEELPTDLRGASRRIDDPDSQDVGNGSPPLVDMGATEFGPEGPKVVRYVGPAMGDWFTATNWSNNMVPSAETDLEIGQMVRIDSPGAVGRTIQVLSEGGIAIGDGSLTAHTVLLESASRLALETASALLHVNTMQMPKGVDFAWSSGVIRIDTGQWTNAEPVQIPAGARLELVNGGRTMTPDLTVMPSGHLKGTGRVLGNVANEGVVEPGESPGLLVIEGTYSQSNTGELIIELDGYVPEASFDVLRVTGDALLDGTLRVQLLGGFSHHVGERHAFMSAAKIFADFAVRDIPTLPGVAEFRYEPDTQRRVLLTMIQTTGPRLYVNGASSGGGDGQSWQAPLPTLEGALQVALTYPSIVTEIWVAKGVYRPTRRMVPTESRTAQFVPVRDVSMYGSFAGDEETIEERDLQVNRTVLSGDLNGDDAPGFVNRDDNAFKVVWIFGPFTTETVFDGFEVSGGNAVGVGNNRDGAGMHISNADPIVRRCRFIDNSAFGPGGGLLVAGGARFELCEFRDNRSFSDGAGAFASSVNAFVEFRDCWFVGNFTHPTPGGYGGGLYFAARTGLVVDCTFEFNYAHGVGRGGGGMFVTAWRSPNEDTMTIQNCAFLDNSTGGRGGGLFVEQPARVHLIDAVFEGNVSDLGASAIYNWSVLEIRADLGEDQSVFNRRHLSIGGAGAPISTLTVGGDFTQQSAGNEPSPTLLFDVAGEIPGVEHDVLAIQGSADVLGGAMLVSFINGFIPKVSDAFHVVQSGSLSGGFGFVGVNGLPLGQYLSVDYLPDDVRLVVRQVQTEIGFGDPGLSGLSGDAADAVMGDFDGDGDSDVAIVIPQQNAVVVLRNAGVDGNNNWLGFTQGFTVTAVGSQPVALATGDYNADSHADLAVANFGDGTVSVLTNNADGTATFTLTQAVPVGGELTAVAAGPIDGNASIDLVVARRNADALQPLLNNGSGGFSAGTSRSTASAPSMVRLLDVNQDGHLDLVAVATANFGGADRQALAVHLSDAGSGFGGAALYEIGDGAHELVGVDLNLDDYPDIATANTLDNTVSILINLADGTGALAQAVNLHAGLDPTSITALDADQDGDSDLAVTATGSKDGRVIYFLRNDLQGNQLVFAGATELATDGEAIIVRTGDLNGDQVPDLVAINAGSQGDRGQGPSVAGLVNVSGPTEQIVTPSAFTRLRGLPVSGGLADLLASDDLRLVTRPDVFRTSSVPPVQVEVRGTTTLLSPVELRFTCESRASVNNIVQRILLYNYDTQAYELRNQRILPTTDTVTEIAITTDAWKYVHSTTGEVKALMQHNAAAFTIAPTWTAGLDQTVWLLRN